eukprot:gnl/MRDRNA2_/MRDRNA2_91534_c0_seq1.p1 gnl/MRDRNA2_/MRDRNA2_91534_c0~~gnl/MRDRNA2_/MRDRNA2_91534_c0_seq1.p1  ORF type:complete len:514 (-),score=117.95 gnl/MRDRNA2_/MRDRNA2_91534_c0_seq1:26-1567(-)
MRTVILLLSAVCIFDLEFAYCSVLSPKQANLKSVEDLQAEVNSLKEKSVRLRGLLGKATSTANTTSKDFTSTAATSTSESKIVVITTSKDYTSTVPTSTLESRNATRGNLWAVHAKRKASTQVLKPDDVVNASHSENATSANLSTMLSRKESDDKEAEKDEEEEADEEAGNEAYEEEEHEEDEEGMDEDEDEDEDEDGDHEENLYSPEAAVAVATVNQALVASNSTQEETIIRELGAPIDEIMKPIKKAFKEMIAKLEKLNKHDGDENRMAFCEQIAKDLKSCEAPFKVHKDITYKEHSASECFGVRGPLGVEITSDSADECQTKCNDLGPDCAGFIRMTSSLGAGKCVFKKGGIKDVKTSDEVTCFEKEDPRAPVVKRYVALNLWALEQASKEMKWICQKGFRSTREENRVEAFRKAVKTYTDGLQCQPGDIPCPGGRLIGEKPMCKCVRPRRPRCRCKKKRMCECRRKARRARRKQKRIDRREKRKKRRQNRRERKDKMNKRRSRGHPTDA